MHTHFEITFTLRKIVITAKLYVSQSQLWLFTYGLTYLHSSVYKTQVYHAQGLFERHKLIMTSQLCMVVLRKSGKLQQAKYDYIVRGPRKDNTSNIVKDWLPDTAWSAAVALAVMCSFKTIYNWCRKLWN